MKNLVLKNKLAIIGLFIGAIAGYLYWYFIGCSSGTCMITSKPINSTIYFAVVGAFLFSSFSKSNN